MRFESGSSGYEEPVERIVLPFDDEVLRSAVLDQEGSSLLLDHDPVLWVRSAIGADTGLGASAVTDRELAERHSGGGFLEWDPKVAKAVRTYLRSKGFIGLSGSDED